MNRFTSHLTVEDCHFDDDTIDYSYSAIVNSGPVGGQRTNHITFRNNTFRKWGEIIASGCDACDQGNMIQLQGADKVLIEGNDFTGAEAGHALLDLWGNHIVIRDNQFENTLQKCVDLGDRSGNGTSGVFLIESNTFTGSVEQFWNRQSDGGLRRVGGFAMSFFGQDSIIRYNIFHNNELEGVYFDDFGESDGVINNRVYNNIFYNNGRTGMFLTDFENSSYLVDNNEIVNNLFVDNGHAENPQTIEPADPRTRYNHSDSNVWERGVQLGFHFKSESFGNHFVRGNMFYHSAAFDNLIGVEAAFPGRQQVNYWDNNHPSNFSSNVQDIDPQLDTLSFTLPIGSAALSAGVELAEATNSGNNSTSLLVDDARYFSDGWGLVPGDFIIINGGPALQITNADLLSNTLTLSAPGTWNDGDPVSIYTNSLGQTVYGPSGPGAGAIQFPVPVTLDLFQVQ